MRCKLANNGSGISLGEAVISAPVIRWHDLQFDLLENSSFDPEALWDRVGGDIALLRELVEIFVQEYPALLRNIALGIHQGAFEDVQKFSHKLKGSALQLSAAIAAGLAESLERMGREKTLQGAAEVLSQLEQETGRLRQRLKRITA